MVREGQKLAIPVMANRTYRPGIEIVVTSSMVEELGNSLSVVLAEKADVVLVGTIDSYERVPVSYTADDHIRSYRSSVTITVEVQNIATQRVIWKDSLSDSQVFPANSSPALQRNSEDEAIREIGRKIARVFHRKLNDSF